MHDTDWNLEDECKSKREWYEENLRSVYWIHLDKVLKEATTGIERKQTEKTFIKHDTAWRVKGRHCGMTCGL